MLAINIDNKRSLQEIADDLEALSAIMSSTADAMAKSYDDDLISHSFELSGAAIIALGWSEGLREKITALN